LVHFYFPRIVLFNGTTFMEEGPKREPSMKTSSYHG